MVKMEGKTGKKARDGIKERGNKTGKPHNSN